MNKVTKAERALERAEDKVIDALYREHCSGMQISVMRIPALFKMARAMLRAGTARSAIGEAMVAFVKGDIGERGMV